MGLSHYYLKMIGKQLKELGSLIDDINEKIKHEATAKYGDKIESLKAQKDEILQKLNKNIDNQLREWGEKIEDLTDKTKTEAKEEYDEILKNIRPKINEFKSELDGLKKSGSEALVDIKSGAGKAFIEMKKAMESAISKFKK